MQNFAFRYKLDISKKNWKNIDVKVINENKNGIGEIAVKGDNVFLGYINNQELTKSVFTSDGYFLTGDYGYIKNKKIYIVGRKSDVIVGDNGENVYPKEIEKNLKEYCNDITKLQAYLVNGKVKYKIFIKENSDANIDKIIEEYNSKSTKKDYIKYYKKIYSNRSFKQ